MNCPSRTDEPEGTGMNQNPNALAADLTTREDLNGIANARLLRRNSSEIERTAAEEPGDSLDDKNDPVAREVGVASRTTSEHRGADPSNVFVGPGGGNSARISQIFVNARDVVKKFGRFIGPGMMVSAFPNLARSRLLTCSKDCCGLYRPRELLDGCGGWCFLQVPPSLHCVDVEHLCYFLAESLH